MALLFSGAEPFMQFENVKLYEIWPVVQEEMLFKEKVYVLTDARRTTDKD